MAVGLFRPDVSELSLRTYSRTLHPELFEHHCGLVLTKAGMKLDLRLHASGHVLNVTIGEDTITEVMADRHTALPDRRKIVDYRLRGCRTESANLDSGLRYDMSCQVEHLHLDIFLRLDEELELDRPRADLSSRFGALNRLLPGPLSLIRTEVARDSLLVYAFHTFPEHCAVVKTQSLFERITSR